jgi:hypothetical protein
MLQSLVAAYIFAAILHDEVLVAHQDGEATTRELRAAYAGEACAAHELVSESLQSGDAEAIEIAAKCDVRSDASCITAAARIRAVFAARAARKATA